MTGQQSQALAAPARTRALSFPEKLQYAKMLADSGLLPAQYRKQPANLLYAIEYGEMLGLPAMAAINGVHVIEGKPSASAALISALVRRAGHRLRITGDAQRAVCEIVRKDDPDYTFRCEWTMERARSSGLGNKPTWKNYPAAMLKARALTECARDACQEALCGLQYTPEELGAETDAEGEPIPRDAEVVDDGGPKPGAQRQAARLAARARQSAQEAPTCPTAQAGPSVQQTGSQESREPEPQDAPQDSPYAEGDRTGSGAITPAELAAYVDPGNPEGLAEYRIWPDELLAPWDTWKDEPLAPEGKKLHRWTPAEFVQGDENGGRHQIAVAVLEKIQASHGPATVPEGALRLDYCLAVMKRRWASLRLQPQVDAEEVA